MISMHHYPRSGSLNPASRATRLFFLMCGTAVGSWAPMVPFAKIRLGLSEADLGILLFALGGGALLAMPIAGWLIHRFGSRSVSLGAGILAGLVFPFLAVAKTTSGLGLVLFIFGASLGAIDVAVNAQAVLVEARSARPLMSSFHGLYSLGGLMGALVMTGLLELGASLLLCAISVSVVAIVIAVSQFGDLLSHTDEPKEEVGSLESDTGSPAVFSTWNSFLAKRLPHGAVLLLGILCFICFLAEGAVLDWSAVLLRFFRNFDTAIAGIGYAAFSVAMAVGRLNGDRMVHRYGPIKMMRWGGLIAAMGFFICVLLPWGSAGILGFLMIGAGAANIVPVLFSAAGRLPGFPPSIAIPAVTTLGYSGLLIGPAVIGFVADATGLPLALAGVGALMLIVGMSSHRAEVNRVWNA